jgi:hypothetical protein
MTECGEGGARSRVERIVHEAMLTLAVQPSHSWGRPNSWPEYLYEPDEHGAYPEEDERPRPPWNPTPRHIDEMHLVLNWYGTFKGKDRKRNGLFKWEYALLEVRATQHLCGKPSWRKIASAMELVERAPTRSHVWWHNRHADLIQIAEFQAVLCGDDRVLARAA